MPGVETLYKRRWDLSDGSRVVMPTTAMAGGSVLAALHPASPNAWSQTINVGWTNNPSGASATLIGTLTSAAPGLRAIDVSTTGYLVFELATPQATQTLLDLWAYAKGDLP